MPDKTYFEERLERLRKAEGDAFAQAHALSGARQECELTLREFDKETAEAPTPLTVVPPPQEREAS